MELFLINALAFLRPVLSIDTGLRLSSFSLFELAAIFFSAIVVAAFGIRAAVRKTLNLSVVDIVILGFVGWCIAIYFIYMGDSHVNVLAKFIIPPLTYMVAKSAIPDRTSYQTTLLLLVVGFAIPLLASSVSILAGGGLERVNYWTGIARYQGVYYGAHDMSHNAAFLIMVVWLYLLLRRDSAVALRQVGTLSRTFLFLLVGAAVYLIYMGRVRTTLLGLFFFAAVLLALYYKRLWVIVVATVFVGASAVLSEDVQRKFFPEGIQAEKTADFDVMSYGSNRPAIWKRQMAEFLDLPLDRQLAGIGIGNTLAEQTGQYDYILEKDTHNDFLRVMVHTGLVGFALFVALQVLLLKRVLTIDCSAKWAFLALFGAVTIMNLASNSYVSRFGLAQMFYLLMAYVELPGKTSKGLEGAAALGRVRAVARPLAPGLRTGDALRVLRR